jgi:hypothetical protein
MQRRKCGMRAAHAEFMRNMERPGFVSETSSYKGLSGFHRSIQAIIELPQRPPNQSVQYIAGYTSAILEPFCFLPSP